MNAATGNDNAMSAYIIFDARPGVRSLRLGCGNTDRKSNLVHVGCSRVMTIFENMLFGRESSTLAAINDREAMLSCMTRIDSVQVQGLQFSVRKHKDSTLYSLWGATAHSYVTRSTPDTHREPGFANASFKSLDATLSSFCRP
jgi:hypothetical protein